MIENDMSAFDNQTLIHLIEVEFLIYRLLGCDQAMLDTYHSIKGVWRFKSKFTKGTQKGQRLTGEPTTSLGNVLVNMICNAKFVLRNYKKIELCMYLGDDSFWAANASVDVEGIVEEQASKHNMIAKFKMCQNGGVFLRCVGHLVGDGRARFGPDYVRLSYKYEITKGVCGPTDLNLHARNMSYCMMLGATKEVKAMIQRFQYPIEPSMWYEPSHLVAGICSLYNMSEDEVKSRYTNLIKAMNDLEATPVHFRAWMPDENIRADNLKRKNI
jgi:hypothetical protein